MGQRCPVLYASYPVCKVPGQTVVIPHGSPETIDYLENEDTERDMFNTINTGQIPNRLLQDILEEAKHFIHLFKTNPSRFLKRYIICY